jgi:hypothetical protein
MEILETLSFLLQNFKCYHSSKMQSFFLTVDRRLELNDNGEQRYVSGHFPVSEWTACGLWATRSRGPTPEQVS